MSKQKIEATTTALSNLTNYVIQKLAYSQIQEQLAQKNGELLIAENQLKQAKLDALQKQVAPHFIFNVLNSISRLLSMRDYDTANGMLNSFAHMMRYALSNTQSSVLLERELKYVEDYLSIQKIRFGECISYQISCDPALKTMRIPFFSLQPLVENAIEHGLLSKENGGKLMITCSIRGTAAVIVISDNGEGIPEDKLTWIRSCLARQSDATGQHVGLTNSFRRFQLMFDQRFSFSISSTEGEGTEVSITIKDPFSFIG